MTAQSARADVLLAHLTTELARAGEDVSELRQLQTELDAIGRPPSLLGRLTQKIRSSAAFHWQNFVGELRESKEAFAIVTAVVRGEPVTPEQRSHVREQMLDLVKVFPAGLIAAANSAFPVPGTGMFTPWILAKLGLMPSRWREAHILEQLSRECQRLRDHGRNDVARVADAVRQALLDEVHGREQAAQSAGVLTYWDANRNGCWDPDEREAYLSALEQLRASFEHHAARKQWFLLHHTEVFGALRLSELGGSHRTQRDDAPRREAELLVSFAGKSGWVALPDLFGRAPRFDLG